MYLWGTLRVFNKMQEKHGVLEPQIDLWKAFPVFLSCLILWPLFLPILALYEPP